MNQSFALHFKSTGEGERHVLSYPQELVRLGGLQVLHVFDGVTENPCTKSKAIMIMRQEAFGDSVMVTLNWFTKWQLECLI